MVLKLLIILLLHQSIFGHYHCSDKAALLLSKTPIYEFSTRILERVAVDTRGHFVFSPISTWLQLTALAEGANGLTLREIWKTTKHHRNRCFRRKLGMVLKEMETDLRLESRRKSLVIIDKLMDVKRSYVHQLQKFYGVKVMLLDFNHPETSAEKVNKIIEHGTGGVIKEAVYGNDFKSTVLLMCDSIYFKSDWKYPFRTTSTKQAPFYSGSPEQSMVLGDVNMMNQVGYFNVTELPLINSKVLELPCTDGRFSMLLFLPIRDVWAGELYFMLKRTSLTAIYNMFKYQGVKLVNVNVPRFRIRTNVDNLPELVYDMGVRRIFDPDLAELKRISSFKIHTSLMTQTADIEVTEHGVTASETVDFLVKGTANTTTDFVANRPFGYMIVDRKTDIILFAGIYSIPTVY